MKKILFAISMLPLTTMAVEQQDTMVVYQDKRIVIEDDSVETRVSVFAKDGDEYQKSREVSFIDRQEVERVYVSSPFLPRVRGRYISLFPTFWYSFSSLSNKRISRNDGSAGNGLHTAGHSYEWGITALDLQSLASSSNDFFVTLGLQLASVRYSFQNGYLLSSDDSRHMVFTPVPDGGQHASRNTLSYEVMRLPILFCTGYERDSSVPYLDGVQLGLGLSAEWRMNGHYLFRPELTGDPVTRTLKLNHWGVNIEAALAYGPLKIGVSYGLTPLYKTADGTKAYTGSVKLGLNLGELFSKKR